MGVFEGLEAVFEGHSYESAKVPKWGLGGHCAPLMLDTLPVFRRNCWQDLVETAGREGTGVGKFSQTITDDWILHFLLAAVSAHDARCPCPHNHPEQR